MEVMELVYQPSDSMGFTVRPYRMKRLHLWAKRMSQDNTHVQYDDNVADVLKSQGYTIEDAPRSIYKVEKLYSALKGYAPKTVQHPVYDNDYRAGVSLAYSAFAKPKDRDSLTMLGLTPGNIIRITSSPTASAGLTNYGVDKAHSQMRALERGRQTVSGAKAPEPCLAGARTQFNDKTRLVWMYPYSMTVLEGLLAYPLMQEFKRGHTPMAFAMPTWVLGNKLVLSSYRKNWCYSTDMSKFDEHISAQLIHVAFDILRTWFDMGQWDTTGEIKVSRLFDLVEHYFIHTPIVMPNMKLYLGKDHGVPSGSYFTQIIDSIVNCIICGTVASKFNLNVDKKDIFILGDDLVFWSNRRCSLDVMADYEKAHLHVKMHGSEKSHIYRYDATIHFLGRDWDHGYPTLETDEVVKRMVFPERYRKYDHSREAKQRELKKLMLSYAAVYRSAWPIAFGFIDPSVRNIHRGCANVDVDAFAGDPSAVEPDMLSGLERYLRKYVRGPSGKDIPITAICT